MRRLLSCADRMSIFLKAVRSVSNDENLLIGAGSRESALQFLRDWFTHEVKDYLKICGYCSAWGSSTSSEE